MTPASDHAHAAWDRLSKARFVMLTTLDADGGFYSCPMTLQQATGEAVLWFFTSTTTSTARNIERDQRIGVALMDDNNFYVSVYGTASLVNDRDKMRELWDAMVKAWFPQGVEDPHLTLVRLDVERGEYWDSDQNAMLKMFAIAKGLAEGRRPDVGEKGTIEPADAAG
ncbi:MAG: pyridoxamine 5'-phosphate oxidase family protein [Burkholderiaceae bacterium]